MSNIVTVNSGSAIGGSLKAGRVSISTDSSVTPSSGGKTWYNMINPAGGYTFISDPKIQGYNDGPPIIYPTQTTLPSDILATINGLPDRRGSVAFDNVWDALIWVQSTGKYFILDKTLSGVVSDGIALALDFSQLSSYPQSGSTAFDLSGESNNGTLTNGPTFNINGWFNFDGTDDEITVPDNSTLDLTTDMSFEFLFKASSSQNNLYPRLIDKSSWLVHILQTPPFGIYQNVNTSAGLRQTGTTSNIIQADTWTHVISNYDGQIGKIYINGNLVRTRDFGSVLPCTVNGTVVTIGGDTTTSRQLNGSIAKTKIYNRALSESDVKQNYYGGPIVTDGLVFAVDAGNLVSYENGDTTTYSMTGSSTGTLNNGVAFNSEYGGSWVFDGTDDNINTNFTIPAGNRSMDLWIKYDTLSSSGGGGYSLTGVQQSGGKYLYTGITSNGVGYSYAGDTGGSYNYTFSAGVWYHLATVMDSGTTRHYVNGVQVATRTYTNSVASTTPVMIGAINSQHEVDGSIPITRIYNKALTAAEVQQNYNATYPRFNSSRDIPKDGLILELDAHNPDSYLSGTTWNDLSGQGNNGTLTNGVEYTTDNGGIINFDGTDDYVDCGVLTGLSSTSITTDVWVRFDGALDSNDRKIFCYRKSTGSPYAAFQLRKGNGTTGLYYQYNNGGTWYTVDLANAMNSGDTWYKYTIVQDGTNVKTYINGDLFQNDNFAAGIDYSGVNNFLLGWRTSSEYWKGDIAEMKIYSRALSASEVKNIYTSNAPRYNVQLPRTVTDSLALTLDAGDITSYPREGTTWYDRSGNGYNNTLNNGPTYNFIDGGTLTFDGTDDYSNATLTGANFDSTGFTLETWIKLLNEPGAWRSTFNIKNASNVKHIDIRNSNGSGTMSINYYPAASDINAGFVNIPENEWFHLVGVWDTEQLKLYVNGYQSGSIATMTSLDLGTSPIFQVGRAYDNSRYINDEFSMIKVYDRGLSPSEVLENYKSTRSRFGTDGIVTSNLILHLDPGDLNCWTPGDTTCVNLVSQGLVQGASGNPGSGTNTPDPSNFPAYNSINGGVFDFEGGRGMNVDEDLGQSTTRTLQMWVYKNNSATQYFSDARNNGGQWFLANYTSNNITYTNQLIYDFNNPYDANSPEFLNQWLCLTVTSDNNGSNLWINDTKIVSGATSIDEDFGKNFRIGTRYTTSAQWTGDMGVILAYNTVLTDAQILQNYNTNRNRFGTD